MKTVLLAEDNEDDALIMKMACQRTGIPHHLHVVSDGNMAVDYLAGQGIYQDRTTYPFPDVVFLDLKMPNRDGHEVLSWIQKQENLKALPVIVLTVSGQEKDINRAYQLGATSYLQKIANLAEFGQSVRIVLKYWLELNVTNQAR